MSESVTPWRTVSQAAARAQTGDRLIYREVKAGRLKAARVGGRRELRFLDRWIDEWLEASTAIEPLLHRPRKEKGSADRNSLMTATGEQPSAIGFCPAGAAARAQEGGR